MRYTSFLFLCFLLLPLTRPSRFWSICANKRKYHFIGEAKSKYFSTPAPKSNSRNTTDAKFILYAEVMNSSVCGYMGIIAQTFL